MKQSARVRTLDAEARSATATRRGLRILDLERRAAERFDEIDRAAFDQIEAHRVDHELHAAGLADEVVGLGGIGEIELVLEARAAAAFDRQAQDCWLALLARDQADALGRRPGQCQYMRHAGDVGCERPALKRCGYNRASPPPHARPVRAG